MMISHSSCKLCDRPNCPGGGPDLLREYENWNDLTAHCSEEWIVKVVNTFVEERKKRKLYHERNNARKKEMVAAAERMLDPDEIREIDRRVKEMVGRVVWGREGEDD